MRPPLVVAPLPAELPRCRFARSLLTGPGPLEEPLELPGEGPVVVAGTCGALVEGVPRGRLVLPRRLVDEAGRVLLPDPALRERLRAAAEELGLVVDDGALAAAVEVVDAAPDRRSLAERTLCRFVDLESAALARSAAAAGRPWAVLRFVSDGPEEPLGWLSELYGGLPEEQPGVGRTLLSLARRPRLLGRLLRLGRAVARGRRRAGRVLRAVFAPTRRPRSA